MSDEDVNTSEVEKKDDYKCGYCGCKEEPISGDEVFPGYDGWPCCPNCSGV